jgi:hypothetical protein
MSWEGEGIREEARRLMATIDGDEKIEKRRRKTKAQIGDEASLKRQRSLRQSVETKVEVMTPSREQIMQAGNGSE